MFEVVEDAVSEHIESRVDDLKSMSVMVVAYLVNDVSGTQAHVHGLALLFVLLVVFGRRIFDGGRRLLLNAHVRSGLLVLEQHDILLFFGARSGMEEGPEAVQVNRGGLSSSISHVGVSLGLLNQVKNVGEFKKSLMSDSDEILEKH